MSKKIRITEEQLKVLLESNKKEVKEQLGDGGGVDTNLTSVSTETSDVKNNQGSSNDFINSISEHLSNAFENKDWSLVEGVLNNVRSFTSSQNTSKEDQPMENEPSTAAFHDDNILQMSESIKKIRADFQRFI